MSIEYTLDIQLTEMGFPDLVHPQEGSVAETPPNSEPSDNDISSQKSLPDHHIQPVKSKNLTEEKRAQSSESEETSSAYVAQSEAINKAGLTTEGSSDDSDVSYNDDEIDDEDDEEEEEEDNEEEGGIFPCNVCSLQCSSMFKLQDHMNLHTGARPYYCAECGKRFSQIRNYRNHLRSHSRAKTRQPKCRICLRRFVNETDLKYHLTMNHFEDKFYECDRCKRVFTCLKACEHHIEFSCMRKVMCENCGRYFPKEKLLRRHLESKMCYNSVKCTECSQIFAKKNELLKHSFSHLGLLPYTCVRCRCHFRLARLYLRHKCKPQSIHCVACLREFLNDHDFQQHKKDTGCWGNQDAKGDEIRCLECGQRFDTKEDLKKHAGAHQRVLKCAECGKGFRSALLLMSHMGGHAGQSPCLCQSCGLGFPHQQSFDIHLKTCGQTPQPTKMSKKHKSSKKSEQKVTKSKPTSLHANSSSTVSPTKTSTGLVTGETVLCEKSSAASEVKTMATEDTEQNVPDKRTDDQLQTSRGPSSSSASPNLEAAAPDNSPTKQNQEAQDDPNDPTKGCWKLSLDKPPPPGVNLLLLLPVSQNQSSNMILPCAVPQVLPVPEMQAHSSPVSDGLVSNSQVSTQSGDSCKQEIDPQPLDLSKKIALECSLNKVPIPSIKNEAVEVDVSAPLKSNGEENMIVQELDFIKGQNKHADNSVDSGLQLSTLPLPTDSTAPKKIKIESESNI